jgi:hypothetical protein
MDILTWIGKSSDGKYYNWEGDPRYCDRCDENVATHQINMYYNFEYWCKECLDKSGDSDPDYDCETASERDSKALDERRQLRGLPKI